ncbi:MAG: hypothetical protein WKG01_07175 [Kofleriaceae bacterium]
MHARVRAILLVAAVTVPGTSFAQPEPGDGADDTTEKPAGPFDKGDGADNSTEGTPKEPPTAAATQATEAASESPSPPPEPEADAAPKGFTWAPYGYLRLQYVAVQNDPNVAFVGRGDGFELQNARVGVRGQLDDRASFVVSFDGAVDERDRVNVPQGRLRVGLRDAFADLTLTGRVVARAGFFQSIVDPQALVPDTRRHLVDKPLESRGMRATQGFEADGLTPGRSLGAAIRLDPVVEPGGSPAVGFEVAVQNGADEFASNNDNDKPAVSAALLARFPNDGFLVIAGRFNPRTVGELPFRQDETDLQGSAGVGISVGPVSLGAGGIFQRTSFPSTGGPVQNAFGGHAQVMVTIGAALPIAIGYRFGILDPSSLLVTDRVMEHTAGAVLGVPRYRMRLQLQVTHVMEQAARELSNSRAQIAAEVTL